jgi:tetratricopeptide (TPR) repeat protein
LSRRPAVPRPALWGLALVGVLLVLLVGHRLWRLDERFLRWSASGLTALARYLAGDYAGAARGYRSDLRHRVARHPDQVDPAWGALVAGDLAEARRRAQAQLQPGAVGPVIQARLTLGEVALAEGAPSEALRILAEVLETETDQFDALLLGSVAHARLGDHGRAVDALNRALRHGRVETRPTAFLAALETMGELGHLAPPDRPWCLLAHYHRYLRIFDPSHGAIAIRLAERAIAAGDRPDAAFLTIGIVHLREERRDLALPAALRAIELNPNNAEALSLAAQLHSDRGDLASEYRMVKAAFEAAPGDGHHAARFYHFLLEKLGDYQQALALTRAALEQAPDDRRSLMRLGDIYQRLGEQAQALAAYERLLAVAPRDPAAHERLGRVLLALGRADAARTRFEEALAIDPRRGSPHFGLAMVHGLEGRQEAAVAAYERGLALGGRMAPDELLALCALYERRSQFGRAEQCVRHVIALDPSHAVAQSMLHEILRNRQLEGARR